MTLWADFQGNTDGRLIHKWKHYFPAYERHFAPFVGRSATILEIGIGEGGSLQMWKRYFGPHAQIIGIDIAPRCKEFEEDQIAVRIGSQDDPMFLESIIEEFGILDVVIDDGSHIMKHVAASFETLYHRLSKNGVYLVEDLHTAYWADYGGGLRHADSFIEKAKSLIDELNADAARGQLRATDFTRTTHSISFYDSIVAFDRGTYMAKSAPRIGGGKPPADPATTLALSRATEEVARLHQEVAVRDAQFEGLRAELQREREGMQRGLEAIAAAELERQRLNAEIAKAAQAAREHAVAVERMRDQEEKHDREHAVVVSALSALRAAFEAALERNDVNERRSADLVGRLTVMEALISQVAARPSLRIVATLQKIAGKIRRLGHLVKRRNWMKQR